MASSSSALSSNWAALPSDLLSSILVKLSMVEILQNAQKVCRSWRRVCKDPWIWRKIDMSNLRIFGENFDRMCRHVVDLSGDSLVEFNMGHQGTDDLFSYIARRQSNLRCLKLQMDFSYVTSKGVASAATKLPLLEELEVFLGTRHLNLKAIGRSCPLLRSLKLIAHISRRTFNKPDDEALAIAETMPQLRHLEIFGNSLTSKGLNAILDNCLHLEYLDLRCCNNIKLVGDLQQRCSERIRYLKRPDDQPTRAQLEFLWDLNIGISFLKHKLCTRI